MGLLLGIGGAVAYFGKVGAEALFLTKTGELAEASEQADDTYQHGSGPVAIYALTRYPSKLEQAEELGPTPFADKLDISFGMIMVHGRLAQIFVGDKPDGASKVCCQRRRQKRDTMKTPCNTNYSLILHYSGDAGKKGHAETIPSEPA